MSNYGYARYGLGTTVYGPGNTKAYYAREFSAAPYSYGAIRVKWVAPSGETSEWELFRVIRSPYGYPVSPDDGELVSTATSGELIDDGLSEASIYYYTAFIKTNDGVWKRVGYAKAISVKNYNTLQYMLDHLAGVLKMSTRGEITTASENSDLNSFLGLIAFDYDLMKSYSYITRLSSNPDFIDFNFLPSAMKQYGLDYEPEISPKQARVLLKNAVNIFSKKGSTAGLEEYVKAYSGYDTTITTGVNLFLDYNCSSFEEYIADPYTIAGFWSSTNADLEIAATPVFDLNNVRAAGSLQVTAQSTSDMVFLCGADAPTTKGIPVTAGDFYSYSVYSQAASTAATTTLTIDWYDRFGTLLSTSTGTPTANTSGSWTRITLQNEEAPVDAYYAVPGFTVTPAAGADVHYFDAAQFELGTTCTDYEDARLIKVSLRPNRINEFTNPNFEIDTAGWTISGDSSNQLVDELTIHDHNTFSGFALEVYPDATPSTVTVVSDHITTVLESNNYTFSIYAAFSLYNGPDTWSEDVDMTIDWYDASDVLLGTTTETITIDTADVYSQLHAASSAPANTSYAIATVSWTPSAPLHVSNPYRSILLDGALFELSATPGSFFDGSTGIAYLDDLFWEGGLINANNARSLMFINWSVVNTRLLDTLGDWLPIGSTFVLIQEFA